MARYLLVFLIVLPALSFAGPVRGFDGSASRYQAITVDAESAGIDSYTDSLRLESLRQLQLSLSEDMGSDLQKAYALESSQLLAKFLVASMETALRATDESFRYQLLNFETYIRTSLTEYAGLAKNLPQDIQAQQFEEIHSAMSKLKIPDRRKDFKHSSFIGSDWVEFSLHFKAGVVGPLIWLYAMGMLFTDQPMLMSVGAGSLFFSPEIFASLWWSYESIRNIGKKDWNAFEMLTIGEIEAIRGKINQNNWTSCEQALNPKPSIRGGMLLL